MLLSKLTFLLTFMLLSQTVSVKWFHSFARDWIIRTSGLSTAGCRDDNHLVGSFHTHYLCYVTAPRFLVVPRRWEKCDQGLLGPHAVEYDFRALRRHGQPTIYLANSSFPFYLDDSLVGTGTMSSWSNNGGWKPNAYQANITNLCTKADFFLKTKLHHIMTIAFGEVLTCPFYPGFFRSPNITVPKDFFWSPSKLNHFVYGKWLGEARLFTKTGELVSCIKAYFDTVAR